MKQKENRKRENTRKKRHSPAIQKKPEKEITKRKEEGDEKEEDTRSSLSHPAIISSSERVF